MKDPLEPYLEATRHMVREVAGQTGTPEALLSPQDDLEAVARAVGVLVTPPTPRPVLVPLRPTDEFTMDRATEAGPFDSIGVVEEGRPARCGSMYLVEVGTVEGVVKCPLPPHHPGRHRGWHTRRGVHGWTHCGRQVPGYLVDMPCGLAGGHPGLHQPQPVVEAAMEPGPGPANLPHPATEVFVTDRSHP